MLSFSKKDSALPPNLICIRFMCYGDRNVDQRILHSGPNLTGASVPAKAFAAIFSKDQSKPSYSEPRHYIDGQVMSIEAMERFLKDPPDHFNRRQCCELIENAKTKKWRWAVKTRLVANGQTFQDFRQFRECDSVIAINSRYINGRLMSPQEVRNFLANTSSIRASYKREVLASMEKGQWQVIVKTVSNRFYEFKPGDEIINLKEGTSKRRTGKVQVKEKSPVREGFEMLALAAKESKDEIGNYSL